MQKVYSFFFLLLCGMPSYAQIVNNPYLSVYYTAAPGNTIIDQKGNQLLVVKDTTYSIIDMQQHTSTPIPLGQLLGIAPYFVRAAWLTAYGALFSVRTDNNNDQFNLLYEWRQGVLHLLEPRAGAVKAAGNYVAWVRKSETPSIKPTDSLFLKNLATQQVALVADSVGVEIALSKEGMLIYHNFYPEIAYKYQNGVNTRITDGAGRDIIIRMAEADNGKVLFVTRYDDSWSTWLLLYDGTKIDSVAYCGDHDYSVNHDELKVNGGYIAYVVRQDGEASAKTWTTVEDSAGNSRQGFYEEGGRYETSVWTQVLGLSPNGDAMIHKDRVPTGLYYSPRTGNKKLITTTYDRVFFENNTWFMSQAGVLYKISTDTTLVLNVQPFDKSGLANTVIQFTANDFIQHFSGPVSGPGQLDKIKVTSVPRYGRLTVKGKTVFWERSSEITRAELDSMKYTPNYGIVGVDTLQWQGSNGFTYTTYDTAVALHIYPVLNTPPILRTLETRYSAAGSPDTIQIANYPPTRWHTNVTVLLDSSTVLPVTATGFFIIDPATLAPGLHQLQVTFSHPLDTISTSRSFTITALQPLMVVSGQKQGLIREEVLSVYPNPFDRQFTLAGLPPEGAFILSLSDQQGRPVLVQRVTDQRRIVLTVNTPLGKGLYLLNIYSEDTRQLIGTLRLLHL
ncbi:Por secretion system C-terminal sorting domain-containing protein [Chitinophaga rupis]|uniref:Por secretion system C-terminal sorting domain-containing protein n=1 Tax=Chitinophaga rupis TaxID=573321 RepID=A0A1H7S208_9BACT|nr:T9SS type A sorting domain-containing protein [Chitinophaga rupis]SEL66533.1 Por secretion system C-terminal sorting domain-containing protein [Chitinophaga rupis]